jgi:hypothetical protein
MSVQYVSSETYKKVCDLLDKARELDKKSKNPKLSLNEKLEFRNAAKLAREEAIELGFTEKGWN